MHLQVLLVSRFEVETTKRRHPNGSTSPAANDLLDGYGTYGTYGIHEIRWFHHGETQKIWENSSEKKGCGSQLMSCWKMLKIWENCGILLDLVGSCCFGDFLVGRILGMVGSAPVPGGDSMQCGRVFLPEVHPEIREKKRCPKPLFPQNYTPVDPKQFFHIHVVILAPDLGNFESISMGNSMNYKQHVFMYYCYLGGSMLV